MKKTLILLVVVLIFLSGCTYLQHNRYRRYSESILDTFDTLVRIVAYTESEAEFRSYVNAAHTRLQELHRLYDIYNDYEGINNIKAINDQAGIAPVRVESEIIDLLLFSKKWARKTGGSVNIALGPVLKIWGNYRDEAYYDPAGASLPPLELLLEASMYCDIEEIIIDRDQMTVYLPHRRMSLDVGAVAKGFALELVAAELEKAGLKSAIISAGGNIRLIGRPLEDERTHWRIGIQDPDESIFGGSEKMLDIIYLDSGSVDSSGDYQRYYIYNDMKIHHIIDPLTLMPADHYRAVTVVAEDAGIADFMSTALFLLPFEESLALAASIADLEALWVLPDGKVHTTLGMTKILQSQGATNN